MSLDLHAMLVNDEIQYHGTASHFNFALTTGRLDQLLRQNMTDAPHHVAGSMMLQFKVLLVQECCGHIKSIGGLTTVLVKDKDAPLDGAYWWFNNAIERIRPTETIAIQFLNRGEEE